MDPNTFNQDLEALVRMCNKEALEYLSTQHYSESLALLRKAEGLLQHPQLRVCQHPTKALLLGTTLTNLGFYYQQLEKPKVSLHYLAKARLFHHQIADSDLREAARTELATCAAYSQLHQHAQALIHAKAALSLIEPKEAPELALEQVAAYNNAGTEFEHLNRLAESLQAYQRGWELAERALPSHPLTLNIKQRYESAKSRVEAWQEVVKTRKDRRNVMKVPTHIAPIRSNQANSAISRSARIPIKLPTLSTSKPRAASNRRSVQSFESSETTLYLRT